MARNVLALILLAAAPPVVADFNIDSSVEVAAVDPGRMPSFADGSQGKLRYGDGDGGLQLANAFVQLSGSSPSFDAKVALDFNSQADEEVAIGEATVTYRPLPVGGLRPRIKVGAFRPPVSLEHSNEGWATLYTTNASAINSWVSEELGGVGAEASVRSDAAAHPNDMYWLLGGAAFYGNDPAGTLLSWRGWSINNWQTRWGDEIPLADLPVFEYAPGQAYQAEPFLELDDEPGYYVNGEVGRTEDWRIRALYYDNRADPETYGHGQSGWRTRFTSVGVAGSLPGEVGIIAQWLAGSTYAGPELPWGRPVDNDFDAAFVLVTRVWGSHRISARWDRFGIDDNDLNGADPNEEDGDAWTLSYQHRFDEHWLGGVEWVRIDSERQARAFEGAAPELIERTLLAVVRWTY
jgi:hypothetical protein